MTSKLPDIAALELPAHTMPIDWVGMEGIDLPVLISENDYKRAHHARVDAQVDLPNPNAKGIHMSRLHLIIDELDEREALSPQRLAEQLSAMISSHEDCDSTAARIRVAFDLLLWRGALESDDIGGWRAYPVILSAMQSKAGLTVSAEAHVTYSSTCPCSAALARQLIERGFLEDFADETSISVNDAAEWLRKKATLATPHSQRSVAKIRVAIENDATDFGLIRLIDRAERTLGTPVQTAVKRIDEQAFAARNGQNLMFVEDAVRRIHNALARDYARVDVDVTHLESLHAHDAVASTMSAT